MIGLTIGEPAGIGPDIVLKLWQQHPDLFSHDKIIIFGNQTLLKERAKLLGISSDFRTLSIVTIPHAEPCIPGKLNAHNAQFVIEMLTTATDYAIQKKIAAIVTAPIHKGIINDAGFSFKGHTDFFSKVTHADTVMMLMNKSLKIALFSDHMPLRDVPTYLTPDNLTRCLTIIIRDFQHKLGIANPSILVCGLNPHAGEQGYLGAEEIKCMTPVLNEFRARGHTLIGPIGADVAFTQHYRNQADVILAMYHDQGLPVIKYAGFNDAINVTLGLPFVRTSVDHGTALDIAGTGRADVTSLYNAIRFAEEHA